MPALGHIYGEGWKGNGELCSPTIINLLNEHNHPRQIETLKITLSPCLVNISDGDKIPIDMFFEWGQDRDFENYLVPMPSKYF